MKPTMKALRTVLKALSLLAVIGSCGLLEADPSEATITSPAGPITVAQNQTVTFAASSAASVQYDSYRVNSFTWNFGDGTPSVLGSGPSGVASHAYVSPGIYTATLTVSYTVGTCLQPIPGPDGGGCLQYSYRTLTATATRTITVLGPPSISSFTANPSSVRAGAGQPVTLSWVTANATSLSISGVGAVTGTSVVVYPTTATTYTLTASNAVGSATASTPVNTYSVTVAINPTSASLLLGGAQTFTATVNPPNQGVSWSATGGSMSGGTFTGTSPGTFTVTATSLEDPSKSASATVTVASAAVGTPAPANATVNAGSTVQYSATVSGAVNTGVNWSVNGGGTISASGLFSATTAGTYTVTATSVADGTKSASTPVTVASAVTGVSITPPSGNLLAGETKAFTATVTGVGGPSQAVTWSATGGTITSGGLFTAPITGGPYSVTATSVQDTSKSAAVSGNVTAISVATPSPANATVNAGSTLQYSATVTGGVNTSVNWSVSGGGTISSSGLFSATTGGTYTVGTYTVTATSTLDPTKKGTATVTVTPITVSVPSPANATVNAGSTQQYSATVSGAANTAVTWSVTGGGTISTSGLFTATTAGTFTVKAASAADPTVSASTGVTVKAVVTGVTVTPATASLNGGQNLKFSATVSGTGITNPGVTWSATGGSIGTDGTFTAPNQSGSITVTATSLQDGTKTGAATVTVRGWVLKLKKDIVYVGTKEVAEVDAQGAVRITLVDHLGSPRFLVGPTGVLESTQKYLPFGESLADPTSAAKFAKGFTNHEQTDPSGLIYMQARFYLPQYGRFASPDPGLDQHFQDTQSWNIYSYVRNQPTMKIDPTGMEIDGIETLPEFQRLTLEQMGVPQERADRMIASYEKGQRVTAVVGATVLTGGALLAAEGGAAGLVAASGTLLRAGWDKGRDLLSRGANALGNLFSRSPQAPPAGQTAFDVAATGGKHAGFLKTYADKPLGQIQKGISSIQREISEHLDKIQNPSKYIENFSKLDPRHQQHLINVKWPSDIARQKEQMQILQELAKKKQ